ncbi:hypothetical protein ACSBL2_12020 [Pedobacter sp. AW31-3R]|uniref:hypothetical protein n=1 Tax=Pedobacter sp. AW31-3R TaxID=3445781 RepID=UPI003FA14992
MSENKDQSQEEKSASILKEVHQDVKENPASALPDDGQPTDEEAAEQQKGSDTDVDRNVGFDDRPDAETTKEQEKGTG